MNHGGATLFLLSAATRRSVSVGTTIGTLARLLCLAVAVEQIVQLRKWFLHAPTVTRSRLNDCVVRGAHQPHHTSTECRLWQDVLQILWPDTVQSLHGYAKQSAQPLHRCREPW